MGRGWADLPAGWCRWLSVAVMAPDCGSAVERRTCRAGEQLPNVPGLAGQSGLWCCMRSRGTCQASEPVQAAREGFDQAVRDQAVQGAGALHRLVPHAVEDRLRDRRRPPRAARRAACRAPGGPCPRTSGRAAAGPRARASRPAARRTGPAIGQRVAALVLRACRPARRAPSRPRPSARRCARPRAAGRGRACVRRRWWRSAGTARR